MGVTVTIPVYKKEGIFISRALAQRLPAGLPRRGKEPPGRWEVGGWGQ